MTKELAIVNKQSELPSASMDATSAEAIMLNPTTFSQLQAFSEYMATAKVSVPEHLRNNPGDCFAVVMQSSMWGMNPFAVSQKTHLVNGKLGYEAQLVNAVISQSGVLDGRPRYEYVGDWSKVDGRAAWNKQDEEGLGVKVIGKLKETGEELEWTCYMSSCHVRNSPNWKSKPKLQVCYQAIKEWCRVHTPDVILGVSTVDEIDDKPTTTISITDMPEGGASRTDQLAAMLTGDDEKEIQTTAEELPPTAEEEPPDPDWEREAPEPEPPKAKSPTKSDLMQAVAKSGIPDEALNEFLAAKDAIKKDGNGYLDAKAAWARRIVENPKGLAKVVNDWLDESSEGDAQ